MYYVAHVLVSQFSSKSQHSTLRFRHLAVSIYTSDYFLNRSSLNLPFQPWHVLTVLILIYINFKLLKHLLLLGYPNVGVVTAVHL